jgi:hypothetical protein
LNENWRVTAPTDAPESLSIVKTGIFYTPMNQETAVPVEDAAKVVERRAKIQVGNIDMPMLVRLRR